MPKVLIVGCLGNMGKRYKAIFSYLGIDTVGVDIGIYVKPVDITHIIICTPTETHIQQIYVYTELFPDASILVEKPLALNCEAAKQVFDIGHEKLYIVNNWAHAHEYKMLRVGQCDVLYNYYQTGPHGLYVDCCQLIYLSKSPECCSLQNVSPVFCANVDGCITKEMIDWSYIKMINAWLGNEKEYLWDMIDAVNMAEMVENYEKHMGKSAERTN